MLSHKCWPRDVKHVENTTNTPNLQMAVGVCRYNGLGIYSLDVICVQITAFSKNVVFRKLTRSELGELILKLLIFKIAISVIFMYN